MPEEDDCQDLPRGDAKYIKSVFETVMRIQDEADSDVSHELPEIFFWLALMPYFNPLYNGMRAEVGHFLYRLSGFLPEGRRKHIPVYPDPGGHIIPYDEGTGQPAEPLTEYDTAAWASLEDWRREWESRFPHIPEFKTYLPHLSEDERKIVDKIR